MKDLPYDTVVDLLTRDDQSFEEVHADIVKKIFLSMQGSWLKQHFYTYSRTESPSMEDADGKVYSFRELDNGLFRWTRRKETVINRTMYAWGLWALNTEHCLVTKAMILAKSIPHQ